MIFFTRSILPRSHFEKIFIKYFLPFDLKHSLKIRDDIRKIELLKIDKSNLYESEPDTFRELASTHASFLFTNYSDIFNRILKNELNLDIMGGLLGVLNMIEEGKVDQHEGSVMVGKLLKELYVDSALKRSENLDKENQTQKRRDDLVQCLSAPLTDTKVRNTAV